MGKKWHKVLLPLLLSSSAWGLDCTDSGYTYRGKPLCFSPKLKTYLSPDCRQDSCGALKLLEQAGKVNKVALSPDSRHAGSKICESLGGVTMIATENKNQLCVCEAGDTTVIACQRLAF
jgi:hypothetical protein